MAKHPIDANVLASFGPDKRHAIVTTLEKTRSAAGSTEKKSDMEVFSWQEVLPHLDRIVSHGLRKMVPWSCKINGCAARQRVSLSHQIDHEMWNLVSRICRVHWRKKLLLWICRDGVQNALSLLIADDCQSHLIVYGEISFIAKIVNEEVLGWILDSQARVLVGRQ